MSQRKIAILTGTRAEYGLLKGIMREIKADPDLTLQLIVTGMHLSPEFGSTYQLIEQDGFSIDAKVDMLLSADTAVGCAKSVGLAMISGADALAHLQPDILVLLGDRFETFAFAAIALLLKIPIAHIHGGELTEGAIDDAIRHAITKMSRLHFVAAPTYRQRIIQLGEPPNTVYDVGAPGLERIQQLTLLSQAALSQKLGVQFARQNFLITIHPVTLCVKENEAMLQALFSALEEFPDAHFFFTKANADEMGRFINQQLETYAAKQPHATVFTTLGDENYLSLLQYVDVVIGNSSSGIIEVPLFKKPTINIGQRQAKRLRASTIIDCDADATAIVESIKTALSPAFKARLANPTYAYTQGPTANQIKTILKNTDLEKVKIKRFHDVEGIVA